MSEIIARVFQEKNVLRRKSDDVGWAYGSLVDAFKKNKVKFMPRNRCMSVLLSTKVKSLYPCM
jgi:hypothetical protein